MTLCGIMIAARERVTHEPLHTRRLFLMPRYSSTPERFFAKVDFNGPVPEYRPELGPCWLWTAATSNHSKTGCGGYGRFDDGYAHRWVYEFCVDPIPDGLEIDHLCRVHYCQNPGHLEAVTRRENQLRGRTLTARNVAMTHCIHGHPFDEANTYIRPDGGNRQCRGCGRIRLKSYRAA